MDDGKMPMEGELGGTNGDDPKSAPGEGLIDVREGDLYILLRRALTWFLLEGASYTISLTYAKILAQEYGTRLGAFHKGMLLGVLVRLGEEMKAMPDAREKPYIAEAISAIREIERMLYVGEE